MMTNKGITVSYNLGNRPESFYEITVNDLATNKQNGQDDAGKIRLQEPAG